MYIYHYRKKIFGIAKLVARKKFRAWLFCGQKNDFRYELKRAISKQIAEIYSSSCTLTVASKLQP